LTCIGVITKLSATFLGLTIIAIGNALPDALVTIALAKDGYAVIYKSLFLLITK
jgi:Ca2+/Na+ antiporter